MIKHDNSSYLCNRTMPVVERLGVKVISAIVELEKTCIPQNEFSTVRSFNSTRNFSISMPLVIPFAVPIKYQFLQF